MRPEHLNQNSQLHISMVAPHFGHLTVDHEKSNIGFRRLPYYFFLFVVAGTCRHSVDQQEYSVSENELLFCLPHQIMEQGKEPHARDYYKLGFDEECISRLPRAYTFLLNPLNRQCIKFPDAAAGRIKMVFMLLKSLLQDGDAVPELILAHLNTLLTEIETVYFASGKKPADGRLSKFIDFKLFVENNLLDHPGIGLIAEQLAISTDSLYEIVKHYSGLSPKEFVTDRLILEARRRLYYGNRSTVKELAFELGFNDPDYFSRLFKKVTGKTVAGFFKDLS